jgi:MFS family permease
MQRRALAVIVTGQVLGGVGLAAGVSVGALLARQLLDGALLSGLPGALATAGGAAAAIGLSRLMAKSGRRPGLALGYVLGAAGSALVVIAAQAASFALLCIGMALFGVGNVASLQARYAGADLAEPRHRGRSLSIVLFATTFGAVAGPNLLAPTQRLATGVGLPPLAGPFVVAAGAYLAAALVLAVLLRPDPLLLARRWAVGAAGLLPAPVHPTGSGNTWLVLVRGRAGIGVAAMVTAQFVMVMMMTMTPVHMADHGQGLRVIGLVISVHIAGMYLPSPLSGLLADRVGRVPTVVAGAVVLAAAGLALALFLLGLGWSLCLVAGSSLLTDALPLEIRPQAQGNADLLMGLSAATAGAGSGVVLELAGWVAIATITMAVALAVGSFAVVRSGSGVSRSARPSSV